MELYETMYTDHRGELILVPEIPDPVMTGGVSPHCNFCVYHENRDTRKIMSGSFPRCGVPDVGGCIQKDDAELIFIYRHELEEYRARATVAKINMATHGETNEET